MIIMMGIVGAGKGTQAHLLAEHAGYEAISTGELLRKFATPEQHKRMLAGELLADDEIIDMVDQVLDTVKDPSKCLLDGFPRSVRQTEWLLEQVAKGRIDLTAIIHLLVSEEVVRERMLNRGRPDDTPGTISRRFKEYHTITEPILDYLARKHVPVQEVDGDQDPEAVHQDVCKALEAAQE